jgi:anaphase-promoting complex subunit 1
MNRMRALTAASSSSTSSSSGALSLQSAVSSNMSDAPTSSYTDDEGDGLLQAEAAAVLRFPDDHRAREACRMLRCTRRQLLRLDRAPEVTDHEYAARQQARLLLLCERMLAAAPARGMLTLGQCLPSLLQDPLPLAIPPLCLAGRATPGGVIVALNTTAADVAADLTHWPEFHNGVAAGLRLAAAGGSVPSMTRSWVLYNRGTASGASGSGSSSSSKSHDGFLLALGLQRHLQALTGHDISRYAYCNHLFIIVLACVLIVASRVVVLVVTVMAVGLRLAVAVSLFHMQ